MTNYALPAQSQVQSATLRMASQNFATQSPFTFQQQVLNHAGRRWEIDVVLKPMKRTSAEVWLSWLAQLDGQLNTFTMGDPLGCAAMGEAGGTPLVNGADQTGASLAIDGATVSQTDWLKAGDYIQLGTGEDARLYKLTADADTNGSGQATLSLWPAITTAPADNAAVTVANTVAAFRLASNTSSWSVDRQGIYSIQFTGLGVV